MDSNVTKSDRTAAARLLANKQPSTVPAPENTLMYASGWCRGFIFGCMLAGGLMAIAIVIAETLTQGVK